MSDKKKNGAKVGSKADADALLKAFEKAAEDAVKQPDEPLTSFQEGADLMAVSTARILCLMELFAVSAHSLKDEEGEFAAQTYRFLTTAIIEEFGGILNAMARLEAGGLIKGPEDGGSELIAEAQKYIQDEVLAVHK
jgi:hypothetical protein